MNSLLTNCKQIVGVLAFLPFVIANTAIAQEQVMLTITNVSGNVIVELTEEELFAMEQTSIFTENECVDGLVEFSGPLARDIIALLGDAEIEALKLTATNDYSVKVPVSDIMEYDVIFAMMQDSVRFSARDKGPIWVIYPMTDHVELQDRIYNDRLIWQLVQVNAL